MPAFAATALKHDFVFEELRLHWSNPTQELFSVALVCLCEVRPLPAEVRSSGGFIFFDLIETGVAWAVHDGWQRPSPKGA